MRKLSGFILVFLLACTIPAFCHVREWILTYPFWTAPQGQLEFEQWHNAGDNLAEDPEEWFELEYGVTNRYQTALYLTRFAGNFRHKGWKWENIYRLTNPGDFIVDPAVYVEYQNRDGVREPGELEMKLILQRYFGQLAVGANFVWEKEFEPGVPVAFNRFHVAMSHPLGDSPANGGLEFTRYQEGRYNTVMPEISASLGHNLRILAGWEFPLNQPLGGTANGRLRTLFEWEFNR